MAGNVLSWQNLSPRFSNGGRHDNLDAARKSIVPLLSLGDKQKTLETQNAHGEYDATIAKAAAAVTHVHSLSQEVRSGDEGLGLFGFDLSSAETDFWWLGEKQSRRNRNQYQVHGIDLGTWLQKKLENLSAAPDELDHACREARDFASHFRVSYEIFLSTMEAAKPVFSVCTHDRRWLCLLGSRAKIYTRFVGDSAVHTYFGRAPLLVGETAEVVLPSATSTEFDSI